MVPTLFGDPPDSWSDSGKFELSWPWWSLPVRDYDDEVKHGIFWKRNFPCRELEGTVRVCIYHALAKRTHLHDDHRQRVDVALLGQFLIHAPHVVLDALEFGGTIPVRIRGLLGADCGVDRLGIHRQRIKPEISDLGTPLCVNEDTRLINTAYQSKRVQGGARRNPNHDFQISMDDFVLMQIIEATGNSNQLGFNEYRLGPPNHFRGAPVLGGSPQGAWSYNPKLSRFPSIRTPWNGQVVPLPPPPSVRCWDALLVSRLWHACSIPTRMVVDWF